MSDDIIKHLAKHFNIVDVVHLPEYLYRMPDLYARLRSIKKNQFSNNDRIVFVLDDLHFYIGNTTSPMAHNLQQFLYKLDIPNYFCLILSEQTYLREEMNHVRSLYGKESCNIDVLDVYIDSYLRINDIKPIDVNFDLIEKSFIFLSRITRKHRVLLFSLLKKYNLLDHGLVSFRVGDLPYRLNYQESHCQKQSDQLDKDVQFISVNPYTCASENWVISDDYQEKVYDEFLRTVSTNFECKNFIETLPDDYYAHNEIVQRGFLYLGIETAFQYPGAFLTEKTFKGISNQRPFVIVGPSGNLRKLKQYGFKTFSHWWSEEYDNMTDPSQRMAAIFDIVRSISQKSRDELIELGNDMKYVLKYNYDFLTKEFTKSQLESLDRQCAKNLMPRYDTN